MMVDIQDAQQRLESLVGEVKRNYVNCTITQDGKPVADIRPHCKEIALYDLNYRAVYETIECAVNEQNRKLTSEDMELLQPFLLFRFEREGSTAALVDDAFWYGGRGQLYRAHVKCDPFTSQWYVSGTLELNWHAWGRVGMIREENRYTARRERRGVALEDFKFRLGRDGEWSDVLTLENIGAYEGEDNGMFLDRRVAGEDKVSGNSGWTADGIVPGWEIEVVE